VSGDLAEDEEDILEKTEIVVETNTMSHDEFLDCWQYASMIINFHCGGWSQLISRVQTALGITDYLSFYNRLFEQLNTDPTIIGTRWREQRQELIWFLNGEAPNGFSAHTFLWKFNRVLHENFEPAWKFIASAVDCEPELLSAQREFIHNYNDQYPKQIELNHNYLDYLENYSGELQTGTYTYQLDVNIVPESFEFHLDNLYFKRRMAYGKTIIK